MMKRSTLAFVAALVLCAPLMVQVKLLVTEMQAFSTVDPTTRAPQRQQHDATNATTNTAVTFTDWTKLNSDDSNGDHAKNKSTFFTALKVPFYIYGDDDLDWWNATLGPELLRDSDYTAYKHSDDYWLYRAARIHPLRTADPTQAKLFFVPIFWNALVTKSSTMLCSKQKIIQKVALPNDASSYVCDDGASSAKEVEGKHCATINGTSGVRAKEILRLLSQADAKLAESKWFQRSNGRDHIVVLSHFNNLSFLWDRDKKENGNATSGQPVKRRRKIISRQTQTKMKGFHLRWKLPNLLSCNMIGFESQISAADQHSVDPKIGMYSWWQEQLQRLPKQISSRLNLPSMYVGTPCHRTANKTHDFAMIGTLKPDNPVFIDRGHACEWLSDGNYSVSICGAGYQCPALANSKYGFHVRGDTFGSNRLMDTLLSGTIPLFTDEEQYNILPPFVPWKDLSYFVDMTSRRKFHQSLAYILKQPEFEYKKKLDLIEAYRPILDHSQDIQVDMYLAEFARRLGRQF